MTGAQAREWVRNLPEAEKDRIEKQLAEAVRVARLMRQGIAPRRRRERLEPTGVFVQKDVEKIIRRRSA